jgi:hypothetical protein
MKGELRGYEVLGPHPKPVPRHEIVSGYMTAQLVAMTGGVGLETLYKHALELTSTRDVLGRIFEEDFCQRLEECSNQKQTLKLKIGEVCVCTTCTVMTARVNTDSADAC